MEITSFILGVCTVIILVMVVGTFVNYMSTKSLREEINQLNRVIENQYDESEKIRTELSNHVDKLHSQTESNINEVYRHIDSRVDKTINNMGEHVSEIYRQLDKTNSVING
jgi:gas vesicle protein|tara:strand:+ start:257 stop:589 length:333 start_codon:yes stop_codon:yes gene_type:complete